MSERPFILINMAMTADGKIASAGREVTSFGSPRDLRHLYELRSTADAVMSGARTIEQSHATLGNGGEMFRRARLRRGLREHPLRIVVSGSGSISPEAEIWRHRFSPIVVLAGARMTASRRNTLQKLADRVWISPKPEVDFSAAAAWLRSELGVRRLLSEGGGEVNDALFRAGLVDELHLTWCPRVFGGRAAPTISDGRGNLRLRDAAQFEPMKSRRVGDEHFLVFRRAPSPAQAARSPKLNR
jgi:riboflavin-specific deaminase-like protein